MTTQHKVSDAFTSLTILMPQSTQYVYRGYRDKRPAEAKPISVRWTESDHKFIDQMAGKCGVTFSEFVRWVSYFCAVEVNKLDHVESFRLAMEERPKKKEIDYSDYQ